MVVCVVPVVLVSETMSCRMTFVIHLYSTERERERECVCVCLCLCLCLRLLVFVFAFAFVFVFVFVSVFVVVVVVVVVVVWMLIDFLQKWYVHNLHTSNTHACSRFRFPVSL